MCTLGWVSCLQQSVTVLMRSTGVLCLIFLKKGQAVQIDNKRALWHMTGVAAAVALVGCGGGSTSESLPPPTPTPVEYTLSGSAVKGPLVKAKVSAYKLTADGKRGDKLGEGTSVAGGGYSIKYNDYDGPILVEVEATDETEMLDEATGGTVKPVGLKLSAAVVPEFTAGGAKSLTVQVNPLTTNAVADAVQKGGQEIGRAHV